MPNSSSIAPDLQNSAILSWMDEFSPYGIITTDLSFRVQIWNRWMAEKSGLKAADVVGLNLLDLFPSIQSRRLGSRFERAIQGEVSVLSTALHGYLIPMASTVPEAGFMHMQQTARIGPLTAKHDALGTIIVIEDVTQREFQAATLRKQHEREQLLSWALGHLMQLMSTPRIVRELFYQIAQHYDYDGYFLYLRNENHLMQLSSAGGISPEARVEISTIEAPEKPWPTLFSNIPVIINHLQQSTVPSENWPRSLGIQSYLALPLSIGEVSLGALCFSSRTRSDIPADEIELLVTISQYLAIALHREQTEQQLREAQAGLHEHALELELKVTERTRRLREMVSELETFSYSLAHDLRAPIRAMSGYCDVLFEDYRSSIPEEPLGIIERLSKACLKLDHLTRDLLEFSKVSREEIKLGAVPIRDTVEEIISLFPEDYREAIQMTGPLLKVRAHPGLLQRCLQNLVENAMKFIEDGKRPEVCIRSELIQGGSKIGKPKFALPFSKAVFSESDPVESGNEAQGEWVRIWVEDRGIGIPPGGQEKIFGIFERGTSSEDFTGTGIGLAIVARAMERMGGKCGVQPREGGGSSFWLDLQRG
ncbi:MAG: ATP-binding protein [Verrucomicrobiales bacterium]